MKCVNCKNCIGMYEGYYVCKIENEPYVDLIEECIANDDNQLCDIYVNDLDDDN